MKKNNSEIRDGMEKVTKGELLMCMELGKDITSELDSEKLIETIIRKISKLIPADNWSLLLSDQETGELSFKISLDLDLEKYRDIRLKPGEGIAGKVALDKKPMIIEDVSRSRYFNEKIDRMSGRKTRSLICVPLVFGGQTVGVIEVLNPVNLDKKTMTLLSYVADYMAIAVENTRRYRKIETLAIQDNLTGLYNTRYLYRALEELIDVSKSTKEPFSLIFLDLDNFKRVVDTYGHSNGSQVIQEVAGTIQDLIRPPAFGVSYGGDEFVVVLPGYGRERAVSKAEEIRCLMSKTLYLTNRGQEVRISASFGVATFPDDAKNMTRLLNLADTAMFRIKGKGKDAVCSIADSED